MGKDISAVGDLGIRLGGSEDPLEQVAGNGDGLAVRRRSALAERTQRGMVSAEWAVGIVAAVAIAGVLLAVITGGQVQDALLRFILWVIKGFVDVVS